MLMVIIFYTLLSVTKLTLVYSINAIIFTSAKCNPLNNLHVALHALIL